MKFYNVFVYPKRLRLLKAEFSSRAKTRTSKVRVVRDFPNVRYFPDVGPRSPRNPISPSFRPYPLEKFQPMLQSMTKGRFLKRDQLERKQYIEKCSSYLTQKTMLVRLNMNKTIENFRG